MLSTLRQSILPNTPGTADERTQTLFEEHRRSINERTDHMFMVLMAVQWVVGVLLAIWVSPQTWSGSIPSVHIHVWSALLCGGLLSAAPIWMAWRHPAVVHTRYVIAVSQMLWSGLLIHLTGGRIETHFHVFGSLAFLAFYRDWKVLVPATLVVAVDHLVRGLYWPQSVFGVLVSSPWRTAEHAVWVVFEDIILLLSCRQGVHEMWNIADKQARLERTRDMVEEKVRQRTLELEQARADALAASRSKSEFLANMSHEIRTPLTAILGFSETLSDNLKEPENLDAANTIKRNGEHLLGVINDILDLSKVESGKMTIESLRVNPVRILTDVISLVKIKADGAGLALGFEYIGTIPETIQTDPTRLRQILINMIGNAIKFTQVGGVRVIGRFVNGKQKPFMQFDIVDTGIGMTEMQVARLFQPFTQADNSTTRRFGGTGLGLAISKRLAEKLGGDIAVVDTRQGVGTRFRLTVATGSLDDVKMMQNPELAEAEENQEKAETKEEESNIQGVQILLAEDGPDNQRLISHVLKKAGADVTVKENGQLAMEAALTARDAGYPFDVILMDMQMPVMDGYQATRRLREQSYTGTIIALTAHAMEGDRQKCIDAGCDDYGTKPIDRKKLISTIARFVQNAEVVSSSA